MSQNTLFEVKQKCNCGIIIIDNSSCLYNDDSIYNFSYEDTITLDIITLEKVAGPELIAIVYTTHEYGKNLNEVNLPIGDDGLFNVNHIIIPTVDWYYKQKDKTNNKLYKYESIYVSDGKNVYRLNNGELENYDPLQFIVNDPFDGSTIVKSQELLFSICHLEKCYINLCKQILDKLAKDKNNISGHNISQCNNLDDDLKDLIYKRDLIWATINVINYLTQDCLYEEAQKILEQMQSCNGICYNDGLPGISNSSEIYYSNNSSHGTVYTVGCGCGK